MLRMYLGCLLFLGTLTGSIDDLLDLRTQQYPLHDVERVVVFSPYRCGSTLVYNLLRTLFENGETSQKNLVVKSHYKWDLLEGALVIAPVRHPIDAGVSRYRVMRRKNFDEIVSAYVEHLKLIEEVGASVVWYEDFVDDFDHLFDVIETVFSITIVADDRELLRSELARDRVKKYTEKWASFAQYDPETHWHGCHIDGGEMEECEVAFVREKLRERFRKYEDLIARFGYSI